MILKEHEHIRINPEMYIGSVATPLKLLEEVLDNALDEALSGAADEIRIEIDGDNISVSDNGRGIPIEKDIPILISTKLFTGAKFKQLKNSDIYRFSVGLHGVGLVCVNALSKYYSMHIIRENKEAVFEFEDFQLKKKEIKKFRGKNSSFSTKIIFTPMGIFENRLGESDIHKIRKRLKIASVSLPDCKFYLKVNGEEEEIFRVSREDFIRETLLLGENELNFRTFLDLGDVQIFFSFSPSNTIRVSSSVNLLPVERGTHIKVVLDALKRNFTKFAKKHGIEIEPVDVLNGLRLFIFLKIENPAYSSQSKLILTNRRTDFDNIINGVRLNKIISTREREGELKSVLLSIAERKNRAVNINILKRKRLSKKITNLRDCLAPDGELFIVEGRSAAGGLLQIRDPNKHAIFPLRGKIPNICKTKKISGEVSQLLSILYDENGKLRYDKIIITVDADADGKHIGALLIMMFAIHAPSVIKEGRLFLASTPLYAVVEKGEFIPLWSVNQKELSKIVKKHRIMRFKGLGELNPEQLKKCVIDSQRRLTQVTFQENIENLVSLFENAETKRELLTEEK